MMKVVLINNFPQKVELEYAFSLFSNIQNKEGIYTDMTLTNSMNGASEKPSQVIYLTNFFFKLHPLINFSTYQISHSLVHSSH